MVERSAAQQRMNYCGLGMSSDCSHTIVTALQWSKLRNLQKTETRGKRLSPFAALKQLSNNDDDDDDDDSNGGYITVQDVLSRLSSTMETTCNTKSLDELSDDDYYETLPKTPAPYEYTSPFIFPDISLAKQRESTKILQNEEVPPVSSSEEMPIYETIEDCLMTFDSSIHEQMKSQSMTLRRQTSIRSTSTIRSTKYKTVTSKRSSYVYQKKSKIKLLKFLISSRKQKSYEGVQEVRHE